ncbi:MAG: ArnT family glycosyltransferase [Prevotella sp.]|jgi:4-amino-4-deoxy-L-arabinose transferase-like glycosyltransferase
MNIAKRINEETLWLLLLCLAAFFINNSALPTDIMETRNIVTAREIVADGNWLIPTMNGELRIAKPPLPTWIAAVVETLNPRDLSSQRSAAGLVAVMWTYFLYATAFYLSRRRDYARIATIIFLTCYNVILMGRSATWDIYCHAFMMGGIYYLMRLLYDERYYPNPRPWKNGILAGVMMGLSFMSKGPVSFYALLLPFLIAMLYTVRPTMRGKWGPVAVMVLICLVLSSWWYIVLWLAYPDLVEQVIHKESSSWINHNVRPWYYYWRFFSEEGAWGLLLLAALAVPYWRKRVPEPRQYVGSVIVLVVTLVLLSIMPEKKMRYLLPLNVSVAYVVAHIILYYKDRHLWDKFAHGLYVVNGAVLTIVMLAMPVLVHIFVYKRGIIDHGTAVVIDVICLGIAYYLVRNIRLRHIVNIVNSVALLFLVAECFMIGSIGQSFTNPDRHSIKQVARQDSIKPYPFYHSDREPLRIELVYQAGKKILPLNLHDAKTLQKAAPCVLVTRKPLAQEIPAPVLAKFDTLKVDFCDDNIHPKSDKHYKADFLNQISIIREKR